MFDVEYIFLHIRAKSVGEVSNCKLRCPDDNETYADVKTDIDLILKLMLQLTKGHTNKIELTDEMGMIMTYPTIDSFVRLVLLLLMLQIC